MRARIVALAAVAALAASAGPALAHGDSRSFGDCGFDTFSQEATTGNSWEGVVYGTFAVYSTGHGNVVTATVTCEIEADGVVIAATSGSGAGVVTLAGRVSFAADETAYVRMCTVVDYTSDETPTTRQCDEPTTTQMPPQDVLDLFGYAFSFVDPAICTVFRALAPGTGPVVVAENGDVSIAGEPFWICPPPGDPLPADPLPPRPPQLGVLDAAGANGASGNTGDAGFLALVRAGGPSAVCAFAVHDGVVTVAAAATAPGADAATGRCRLQDATTGAVLYERSLTSAWGTVAWHDTFAGSGPITVCVTGAASYGARTESLGDHCRAGVSA